MGVLPTPGMRTTIVTSHGDTFEIGPALIAPRNDEVGINITRFDSDHTSHYVLTEDEAYQLMKTIQHHLGYA